jgi:hypothetical protein
VLKKASGFYSSPGPSRIGFDQTNNGISRVLKSAFRAKSSSGLWQQVPFPLPTSPFTVLRLPGRQPAPRHGKRPTCPKNGTPGHSITPFTNPTSPSKIPARIFENRLLRKTLSSPANAFCNGWWKKPQIHTWKNVVTPLQTAPLPPCPLGFRQKVS